MNKQIGMIGLGVMGRSLVLNLLNHGYKVSGYDHFKDQTKVLTDMHRDGFTGYESLNDFVNSLERPRNIFLMVPAGTIVDGLLEELLPLLDEADVVMDGGNSFYMDTNRRYNLMKEHGVLYMGVGVSGGEKGALEGPSIMPGGSIEAYKQVGRILEDISAKYNNMPCCTYIGKEGSGHYVKMVHNGMEYALMQLIVEVYLYLKKVGGLSNKEIADVLKIFNKGETKSYLLDITIDILNEEDLTTNSSLLDNIKDVARNKGTGRWTSMEALRQECNVSILTAGYQSRIMSADEKLRDLYKEEQVHKKQDVSYESLYSSYKLSMALIFAQGFYMMESASTTYDWDLDFYGIASIFRSGCIIQTEFLETIMGIYKDCNNGILYSETLHSLINASSNDLKSVVINCITNDIAIPVLINSNLYVSQLKAYQLGANLIQAQRDFFGAHTYERIDKEGYEHHDWNH